MAGMNHLACGGRATGTTLADVEGGFLALWAGENVGYYRQCAMLQCE